jgi:hypothetical protein
LFRVVEELKNPANGQTSRMADIEAVRSALNRLAKNPELRDGARLAQKHIDGFLSNIHPSDIVAHPQLAPELNRLATEARGNYAAGSRSEVLDNARDKAILSAHASQGAGTNVDARMRAEIKNILTNERLRRGFSQEELAQMRELIKPPSGQFSRLIGKAAPTGIISAGLGAELGYHLLGSKWAALPAVGYAAKKLADRRTAIRFDKLSEAVRTRSPEGARRAAYNASIQPKGRTPMALQRGLQQEGRFVTPQGENQSRGGAVDRALRLARKH